MSTYNDYVSKVSEVLESKNIQNTPRTIESLLKDLQFAEKFSEKSEYAIVRMTKICKRIDDMLANLASRDHKTQAEALKEELLSDEALVKRALIHASKVQKLADFRAYVAKTTAEYESSVEKSLQRVPFAQREAFRSLLVSLQGQTSVELADED